MHWLLKAALFYIDSLGYLDYVCNSKNNGFVIDPTYSEILNHGAKINSPKKGRQVINSLVRNNHEVAEMLGWNRIPPDIRIRRRIELDKLDEEKFIANWLHSVNFSFLNIIQDFLLLGKKTRDLGEEADSIKKIRRFLEAYIQDVVDVINSYGEYMAKRVRLGTFTPERIWEVRNKLLEQIRNEMVSLTQ